MKHTKLSIFLFAAAVSVSGLFSSCNKKLKDDIKELDQSVSDVQAQQSSIESQQLAVANKFDNFTLSLSTKDDNDSSITVNKTYKYRTSSGDSYMQKQSDGTWYFDLYVTEAAYWDKEAEFWGYYNPTTNTVTQGGVYFDWYDYAFNSRYMEFYQGDAECTVTISVSKFDTTTGEIEASVTGSTTAASGYNAYTGKAMSGNLTIKSKVAVYPQ